MSGTAQRLVGVALAAALCGPGLESAGVAGTINRMVCDLRGGQQVPPTGSPNTGCGAFVIDTDANTLSFYIVFSGLAGAETVAHIHGSAAPGADAGPLLTLPPGNPKTGVWNYPQSMEDDILNARTYVNIHSTGFPDGEIRGQICKLMANIDALQVVPPTACTSASGWGVFSIDICKDQLSYYIQLEGALCGTETAAHIQGPATHGVNAGILHTLPAGNPKVGTWSYPDQMEDAILQGLTCVNVLTDTFPGGVIRGQIVHAAAPLDGAQQVPPNPSASTGCGFFSIDKELNNLGFDIRYEPLASGETGAHIHGFAPPGENGIFIILVLPAANPKLGIWNYGAFEPDVLAGLTYINIHSQDFVGGEIRGQVVIPGKKPPCGCPWDLDGGGSVEVVDFLQLLEQWAADPGGPPDFDGDGSVGIVDFLQLLGHWGPCAPP